MGTELRMAPGKKDKGREVKVEWEYLKNRCLSKSEIRGTERKLWRKGVGVVLKAPAILTRHLFWVFCSREMIVLGGDEGLYQSWNPYNNMGTTQEI